MSRMLVVTNAAAGSSDDTSVENAVSVLRAAGADVDVAATTDVDDLDAVLAERDGRTVVVAGGDGSLHAVVAALYASGGLADAVIGLIPLGTGNDFARGVGIPLDPTDAARVVTAGATTAIDLVTDDAGGVVVNAVHVGVGAEGGRAARPWKRRIGKPGYAIGAALAGIRTRGQRLRVETDGRVLADGSRRVLQVAIGNAPYVGGGTELAPDADPSDARVDVLVSFAVGALARVRYAVLLRLGRHREDRDVVAVRAREVTVSGQPFWLNADGELGGPHAARTWRVDRAAYRLVVPG